MHVGFELRNIVNLICHAKYDKKCVELIFSPSYLIEFKKEPKPKWYTLHIPFSQLYTLILI